MPVRGEPGENHLCMPSIGAKRPPKAALQVTEVVSRRGQGVRDPAVLSAEWKRFAVWVNLHGIQIGS